MTTALVLHPDGELRELNLPADSGDRLRTMYAALDCTLVDVVRLTTCLDMWVDDEGLLTGRPVNPVATALARHYGYVHQHYVGPVLLCSVDDEGNSLDLNRAQVRALLTRLLDIVSP